MGHGVSKLIHLTLKFGSVSIFLKFMKRMDFWLKSDWAAFLKDAVTAGASFLCRERSNGILKMSRQGLAPRPKDSNWKWFINIEIEISPNWTQSLCVWRNTLVNPPRPNNFLYGCCPQREGGPPQAFVLDKQHGTSEKNYAAADFFPFVISGGDNLENEI